MNERVGLIVSRFRRGQSEGQEIVKVTELVGPGQEPSSLISKAGTARVAALLSACAHEPLQEEALVASRGDLGPGLPSVWPLGWRWSGCGLLSGGEMLAGSHLLAQVFLGRWKNACLTTPPKAQLSEAPIPASSGRREGTIPKSQKMENET